MTRNKSIVVDVDKIENQLILQKAKELGYPNKSKLVRDLILQDNNTMERMVNEIWEKVCKG